MKAKTPATPLLPQRLSLVAQTVQSLRESIRSGHWQTHLPGERELAEKLQVSRDTVRAALEELQRKGMIEVAKGQRRRIKRRRATQVAGAQGRVIAILSPRSFLTLPAQMTFLIDALRERFATAGSAVEFHANPACFSAKPVRALEKLVKQSPAAVWLVCGSKEPMQRWFISQQLPCLVLGSCAANVRLPSVDADHQAACRHAGGVLLRKGHRRIALVLPEGGYGGDSDSELGLREALADHPRESLIILKHDGSTAHLCSLLDGALRLPHPPTAFLVARAMHVLTVMMHLMRRGKHIPQDVAVISRDDDPFLQSTSPDLTRYAIDPGQLMRRVSLAVRQLAETGALEPKAIRIIPKFLPGETA